MAASRCVHHVLAMEPLDVLLLDDDVDCAQALGDMLTARGHLVRLAHTIDGACRELVRQPPAVFVTDLELVDESAHALLERVAAALPGMRRVLVSGSPPARWGELVALGLVHVGLAKPPAFAELCAAVEGQSGNR